MKLKNQNKPVIAIVILLILFGSSLFTFSARADSEINSGGTIVNLCNLPSGRQVFYDSNTNRNYYNKSFIQFNGNNVSVADIINNALLKYKGTNATIVIPDGEYILDKPIRLQDKVTLAGTSGNTKFIVDDSFNKDGDDFIVSNVPEGNVAMDGIYVEYRSYKYPIYNDAAEGIILKMKNVASASITNSSFVVKNNGVETAITPVWFREGFSNVTMHDCYIENSSGNANSGGCLWFMNNNGSQGDNVDIYNNTIVKSSRDECIATWGYNGKFSNFNIHNNIINYEPGFNDIKCDKLISMFSVDDGCSTFQNIKYADNNINITGRVGRIVYLDVAGGTFSNVTFNSNIIKESRGDITGDDLLVVFETQAAIKSWESIDNTYGRGDITFSNNQYTNTSQYGRRTFASAMNTLLKLKDNKLDANFVYEGIYVKNGKYMNSIQDTN
ncbi:MAG: hypothetical protein ACM3X7_13290 [Solirubrobacterales bacterium]